MDVKMLLRNKFSPKSIPLIKYDRQANGLCDVMLKRDGNLWKTSLICFCSANFYSMVRYFLKILTIYILSGKKKNWKTE